MENYIDQIISCINDFEQKFSDFQSANTTGSHALEEIQISTEGEVPSESESQLPNTIEETTTSAVVGEIQISTEEEIPSEADAQLPNIIEGATTPDLVGEIQISIEEQIPNEAESQLPNRIEEDTINESDEDAQELKNEIFIQEIENSTIDIVRLFCFSLLSGEYISISDLVEKLKLVDEKVKDLIKNGDFLSNNIQTKIFEYTSAVTIIVEGLSLIHI